MTRDSTTTTKTQIVPVRLSTEAIAYLKDVVRDTNAGSTSEAVRLMIFERMIADKERGEISPFKYTPAPTKRTRKKRSREIETGEIRTLPLREAPPTGGPLTPSADAGIETIPEPAKIRKDEGDSYGFATMKKPVYPGPLSAYKEDLRRGVIREGMFEPPEE